MCAALQQFVIATNEKIRHLFGESDVGCVGNAKSGP
jgi:hypothetical protein